MAVMEVTAGTTASTEEWDVRSGNMSVPVIASSTAEE